MTSVAVVPNDELPVGTDLTESQRKFAIEFIHGEAAGNAVRSYLAVFETTNYNTASVAATRLLKDPRVLRFLEYLRDEAMRRVGRDLKPWRDLVPEAQATLLALMRGTLRSRVQMEAAREILDRALGRPTQPLAHEVVWDERRVTDALRMLANREAGDA